MNSYLAIAEKVLEAAKRPLTARQILEIAYLNEIAPKHLHGKTQYKTLNARISEDVLRRGERSVFYRTNPGVFYLRKYLNTESLSSKHTPFIARRRERDLRKKPVLTVKKNCIEKFLKKDFTISLGKAKTCFSFDNIKYTPYESAKSQDDYIVWAFVVVYRGNQVLSYRKGRYREDRDSFLNKQTIGFESLLTVEESTLFDQNDRGLIWGGVSKTIVDLGMPADVLSGSNIESSSKLELFMTFEKENDAPQMVGVVTFECPDWFEPTTKRLAINELKWIDLRNSINHIEDFDPWSQRLIDKIKPVIEKRAA